MDIKHRIAYARIKLMGQAEPVLLNQGTSLIRLLNVEIPMALHKLPSRYNPITIDIDFKPLGEHETDQERGFREVMSGLDLSNMTIESDEDESSSIWDKSPHNPASSTYDPLLVEYGRCAITSHRETKLPGDLAKLRSHVESTYRGTQWWDGSHRW